MALKFYAPVEFADTSAGLTVNGDLTLDNTSSNFLNLDISGATKGYLYSTASVVQLYGGGSYLRLTAKDFIRFDKGSANSYAEAMRLDGEGRLGIGTTSPTAKLTVSDTYTTRFTGNDILFDRAGPAYINATNASGKLGLQTGGNTRMYINESGNIGVGTANPNAQMHIYSSGNGEIEVERASGALINLQAQASLGAIGTDSNHPLYLKTNATTRAAITTSGNIGIGTTSPSQKLHVSGGHLQLDDTYKLQWGGTNARIDGSNASDYLRFFTSDTERIRIDTSGNVGIGTSSIYGKMHVSDSATGAAGMTVHNNLEASGNSAAIWFKVAGSTSDYRKGALLFVNNGTGYGRGDFYFASNTSTASTSIASTSDAKMVIKGATGNVLVGTTTDSGQKLQVSGNASISGTLTLGDGHIIGNQTTYDNLVLLSSSTESIVLSSAANIFFNTGGTSLSNVGTTLMYIDSGGNVGIGTTSPSYNLEVNGSFSATTLYGDGSNLTGITATETDTLATVTGRGASTSTSLTLSNTLNLTSTTKAIQLGPTSDNNSIYYIDCGNQIHIRANQSGTDNYYTNLMLMSGSSTQTASIGVIGRGNDSRLYFTTSNATKMQLFSTGNLGVGTSSDNGYKLDVNGDTNTTGDYYQDGNQGYTGTITIQQPSPNPPINIEVKGGIITNVS